MSAICGFVNLKGAPVSIEKGNKMMLQFEKYPADYSDILYGDQFFLGCRHKSITPEAKYEKLPYRDSSSGLTITADAIIDNRQDLLNLFKIPYSEWSLTTDSQLILIAYKKWGDKCPIYLVGDFAFAIYDEYKKELFCARDHIGKRAFYFYYSDNIFAFATTMEPLLSAASLKRELNEKWIAYFLAYSDIIHEMDANQTVYKDIFQLLPANTIKVSVAGIKEEQYWSPLGRPELRLKSDAEYEEKFREIFYEAVNCRLRTEKSIGIMLSGGLDSGSVGCVAAQQLEKQGKKLNAYCSIPFSGYKNYLPNTRVANERMYIDTIGEKFSNVNINYLNFENMNSVTNVDYLISLMEQPYKIVENFFWINEIALRASNNNCGIVLSGQSGNASISYGYMDTYLVTLFRKKKIISLMNEIKDYANFMDASSIQLLKNFTKIIMPEKMLNAYKNIRGQTIKSKKPVFLNPELADKYMIYKNAQNSESLKSNINRDLDESRELLADSRIFSQLGILDTKLSLNYGLQFRDPTADKRVFEFCFSVPGEQYVRNGQERYLLRRALDGILPDKIRLNYKVRGFQSADWMQRLSPYWKSIRSELEEMIKMESFKYYIDVSQIKRVLNEISEISDKRPPFDMHMLIVCYILGKFLGTFRT